MLGWIASWAQAGAMRECVNEGLVGVPLTAACMKMSCRPRRSCQACNPQTLHLKSKVLNPCGKNFSFFLFLLWFLIMLGTNVSCFICYVSGSFVSIKAAFICVPQSAHSSLSFCTSSSPQGLPAVCFWLLSSRKSIWSAWKTPKRLSQLGSS